MDIVIRYYRGGGLQCGLWDIFGCELLTQDQVVWICFADCFGGRAEKGLRDPPEKLFVVDAGFFAFEIRGFPVELTGR